MKPFSLKYIVAVFLFLMFGAEAACAKSVKKLKVDSVSFVGVSDLSERRLSKVMITHASRFLRPFHYNEEILSEDLKALELFYHRNGYLEAVITDHRVEVDSTRFRVHIQITLSEGELTRIEGVSVLGNSVFPDTLLLEKISIRGGESFRQKKIDDSVVNLLRFYANNGYLDAEVRPDVRVNTETHRALIDYYITEKFQFTIGEIYVKGLDKTREKVLLRELLFNTGEVVNYSRLLESQRNIYLTGLFQSVFIHPRISAIGDSTKKDMLIDVKENLSGEFNTAFGYGSVDRIRGKMEVFNNNIQGTSLKIGLVGKISFIRRSVETSFTSPWTFGTPISTDVNLFQKREDEPGYDLDRIGGRMIVGRKFHSNNITLAYRHERTKLNNVKVDIIPDDLISNTSSIKCSFIHDTRDNLFNSTNGSFLEASGEFGGFITTKINGFYRFIVQFKYFYPLNTLTIVATSAEVGFIDARGGLGSIPLHERFYTGGPNSLRGFKYEKVGPLDRKRIPLGGKLKFVWNIFEVRRSLYKVINGVVFTDMGNVWLSAKDMRLRDVRISPGLGLRIKTPIGLVRLDYGINVDRRENEPKGQFYFNMGQAF